MRLLSGGTLRGFFRSCRGHYRGGEGGIGRRRSSRGYLGRGSNRSEKLLYFSIQRGDHTFKGLGDSRGELSVHA